MRYHRPNLRLSITCVTHQPNPAVLSEVLQRLMKACGCLAGFEINMLLIDNGPAREDLEVLQKITGQISEKPSPKIKLITGHGNPGFGKAHNLGLKEAEADFHLIINPDLYVEEKTLIVGLEYLSANPDVSMVVPAAVDERGEVQRIAKRYPSLLILLLRGFAPDWLCRLFAGKLAAYEYGDLIPSAAPMDIELASGCFMLLRAEVFKKVGGFCPRFFMYFEDFDLSIRIRQSGYRIVHLPQMRVRHLGGDAAKKGWRHVIYFLHSAVIFFNRHGWRFS